jgi:hypothetical protein
MAKPYTGRFLGRGYWRREWNDIQRRYALDRIRHPRELTLREWVVHARMLLMNLALIATVFAGMWWLADRFNPNMAPGVVGLAVGAMLRDWLYGTRRKERPPVRRIRDDIAHGELLESGTAFNPAPIKP